MTESNRSSARLLRPGDGLLVGRIPARDQGDLVDGRLLQRPTQILGPVQVGEKVRPEEGLPRVHRHNGCLDPVKEVRDRQLSGPQMPIGELGLERIGKLPPARHFRWLAIRQVEGLSYQRIAKLDNEGQFREDPGSTVRKGVKRAASLLGLSPRHS